MPEDGNLPEVILWMFDFDGTLSPLVADRSAASLDPACRIMLNQLALRRGSRCAVISSRRLADLAGRVDVPGIYLGGGSGLEWKLPDGRHLAPGADRMEALQEARRTLIPEIMEWGLMPGVEIEDKQWSVAIHIRRTAQPAQEELAVLMKRWRQARKVSVFRGPAVFEVQLLPEADKSVGIRGFCKLVQHTPASGRLLFAGDDENDAAAMRWVLSRGGIAISVGEKALVPGCQVAASPTELSKTILSLVGFGR